jgi:hypothetical protein
MKLKSYIEDSGMVTRKGLRVSRLEDRMEEERRTVYFDGTNYEEWSNQMESKLSMKNLLEMVQVDHFGKKADKEGLVEDVKNLKERDQKAKGTLGMRVVRQFMPLVNNAKSAYEAWNVLKALYHTMDIETIDRLEMEFSNANFEDGEDAILFMTRLEGIQRRLSGTENKITDSRLRTKIMNVLEKQSIEWKIFLSGIRSQEGILNDMAIFKRKIWSEWTR